MLPGLTMVGSATLNWPFGMSKSPIIAVLSEPIRRRMSTSEPLTGVPPARKPRSFGNVGVQSPRAPAAQVEVVDAAAGIGECFDRTLEALRIRQKFLDCGYDAEA